MTKRDGKAKNELKVFISGRDSTCGECGEELGRGAWITLQDEKGAVCLTCADLDHLVLLASGDAALTRRARKHSRLSAVVLEWSRARKRYERQGLLVENEAVDRAEEECEADAEVRAERRARAAVRRAELDRVPTPFFALDGTRVAGRCRRRQPSFANDARTASTHRLVAGTGLSTSPSNSSVR